MTMNIMRQTHRCQCLESCSRNIANNRLIVPLKPDGVCVRLQRHVETIKKIVYDNILECKHKRNMHQKDKFVACLDDN